MTLGPVRVIRAGVVLIVFVEVNLLNAYNYTYSLGLFLHIFYTVFTWLIKHRRNYYHLCKMTVATIQWRLLFEDGIYCNVIMITMATIQEPVNLVQIILFVVYYSILATRYFHRYKFF